MSKKFNEDDFTEVNHVKAMEEELSDLIKRCDGLNGFIIPQPYSDDAFVAKMDLLMQNEKLFVNMSESAMLKAKDFSLEQIVGKWKRLLLDVINNK